MTIPAERREQVRVRAGFACEYCGVTEADTAGQLTLDHFRPQAAGGDDGLDNLVYCCHRSNEYKSDYWRQNPDAFALWNPRQEASSVHFMELADGLLFALTKTGELTLLRLRLNRPPLVAYRLRRRQGVEEQRLMTRLRDATLLLEQAQAQLSTVLEEHRALLQEQRRLLQILLQKEELR